MPEKLTGIVSRLDDLPEAQRAFVRSLVVTRIAAHYERSRDLRTGEAWLVNSKLLDKELENENRGKVLERAVFLATLPQGNNEEMEWYYRWLRGNGLGILQDERMRDPLIALLDDPVKGKPLAEVLDVFLSADVQGLDRESLSEIPEVYSMFVAFLVCNNFQGDRMSETREKLLEKAIKRLTDPEVARVMAYYGEIEDTGELYARFKLFKDWITY